MLLSHSSGLGPLLQAASDAPLTLGICGCLLPERHTREIVGKLSSGASGRFRVEGNGFPVDVVDIIALEVIANVVRCASAGEDAGGGDAELEESDVVGGRAEAAAKRRLVKE